MKWALGTVETGWAQWSYCHAGENQLEVVTLRWLADGQVSRSFLCFTDGSRTCSGGSLALACFLYVSLKPSRNSPPASAIHRTFSSRELPINCFLNLWCPFSVKPGKGHFCKSQKIIWTNNKVFRASHITLLQLFWCLDWWTPDDCF